MASRFTSEDMHSSFGPELCPVGGGPAVKFSTAKCTYFLKYCFLHYRFRREKGSNFGKGLSAKSQLAEKMEAGTKTTRVWQRTEPSISLGKQTISKVSKCNLYFLLTIIS